MRYWISRIFTALTLSALLAVGITSIPAFALTTNSLHQRAQNSKAACLQPPQNVDLTTLSDAELLSYGLPPHSVINSDPAHWDVNLAHAKHRTCGNGSSNPKVTNRLHKVKKTTQAWFASDNWADNEATGGRGTYRAATATFAVPTISLSDSSAMVDIWVGVGGDPRFANGAAELPQVGVQISVSGNRQYNESWWEVPGSSGDNGIVNLPLKRLNAGDDIYLYVSSNLQNDGYDEFYIENESSNDYDDVAQYTTYSSFSDSATGECVVERPLVGGSPVDLAKFNPGSNTIEISSCEILDRNAVENSVGNWPHTDYHMEDFENNNTPLAYPGALTNNGQDFPVYWQAPS